MVNSEETSRCEFCTCPALKESIFCALPKSEMGILAKGKTLNTYARRDTIFYAGNPAMGIFCVRTGKVKVYKHGPEGQIQIVRLAKPGDLLGNRAFFADEQYSATAEILEESTICFIDRATMINLLQRNSALAMEFLKKIAQELRRAEERAMALVQKSVTQRVVELLLSLQESFGEKASQGIRLKVTLTREEMAEMAGTRTETLIRTLSSLKQRGLVDIIPPHVFIKNMNGLRKLTPLSG